MDKYLMCVIFVLIAKKKNPTHFENELIWPCFVQHTLWGVGVAGLGGRGDGADAMWEQYSDKWSHLVCAH